MEEKDSPKVSVIVPVYKAETFLRQCVESIMIQSLRDIEIILVNDGSPDSSGQICDALALEDQRIVVIHQQNSGGSRAFQSGYNKARGKYILRVDGDDWIDPETCATAYRVAEEKNADIVFWSRIKEYDSHSARETPVFNEDRVFENEDLLWLRRRLVGLSGKELVRPTRTDAMSSVWGKLYKRKIIVDNQVTSLDANGNLNFDVFFTIRAFSHISRAVYINQFFSHYRLTNPNSITKNHGLKLIDRYMNMFRAIDAFIKENNLGPEFEEALQNRIALSVLNNTMSITGPRTRESMRTKISHVKKILSLSIYRTALSQLDLAYLPMHWKVFFLLCKMRSATGVYLASLAMRRLR